MKLEGSSGLQRGQEETRVWKKDDPLCVGGACSIEIAAQINCSTGRRNGGAD
jgi:hypothetical protein